MEQYRKKIKRRMVLQAAMLLVSLGLIAATALYAFVFYDGPRYGSEAHLSGFVSGAGTGMGLVLFGLLLIGIVRCARALRDDARLKRMYVSETDERSALVGYKAHQAALYLSVLLVALSGVIASFFNAAVSLTLLCVLAVMLLARAFLRRYYENTL